MNKAIIIDLKKTMRAIDKPREYLEYFETDSKNILLPEEITPETRLETVNATRKIYKEIKLSFPIRGSHRRKVERYYVCVEDWEKMFPLLKGTIENETATLSRCLRQTQEALRNLDGKWYVKVGRKIEGLINAFNTRVLHK